MTVQEIRYTPRVRAACSDADGGRRFARAQKDDAVAKVQQLQDSIKSGTYTVDSQAVASAILKKLLASAK